MWTYVESGGPHDGIDLDEALLAICAAAKLQSGAGDGAQRLRDELDIVARDGGEVLVADKNQKCRKEFIRNERTKCDNS